MMRAYGVRKGWLATFLAVAMVLSVCVMPIGTGQVLAKKGKDTTTQYETTADGLKYEIGTEGIAIVGYEDGVTTVQIPSIIGDVPIVSIGEGAFSYCESLKNITIPDSVTSIEDGAFYACSKLKSITIPDSVTNIGNSAFSFCDSLTSITLPEGITSISTSTFLGCSKLKTVKIPNSVTSIGVNGFVSCSNLKHIDIPNSVKSIKESAFLDCDSLESITIPDNVISIGKYAFIGCGKLKKITIKSTKLKKVGYYAIKDINKNAVIKVPKKKLKKYQKLFKKSTGYQKSMKIK